MPKNISKPTLLFLGFGALYLLAAVIVNPFFIGFIFPSLPKDSIIPPFFSRLRYGLCFLGLVWIGLGWGLNRLFQSHSPFQKEGFLNACVFLLAFGFPLILLEGISPPESAMNKTTIFQKDETLGWTLKPNATGLWGKVPVRINEKGLRGPAIPHEKPPGEYRILFLGDSVTFGYGLASHTEAFPHKVGQRLDQTVKPPIKIINAGIGGYSTWQEYVFLRAEGIRYHPDLVVLSFVLNDVTEKTRLRQFGGKDWGYQLNRNVNSLLDRSNFYFFLKRYLIPSFLYTGDIQEGARAVDLQYGESLVYEAEDPKIQSMWDITFKKMEAMIALCRKENMDLAIVIFPYTFQIFEPESLNQPQEKLKQFTRKHNIPTLDLLPLLSKKIIDEDIPIDDYFFDSNHPTAACSQAVAEWIADFIARRFLDAAQGSQTSISPG